MPWRTLIELLHMVFGILATLLLSSLASWAVPNARESISLVAWVVAAVVVAMGVRPLRRAWAQDRGRGPVDSDGVNGAPHE
jgi:membrane protein implicated in regulation of membrane protease activity